MNAQQRIDAMRRCHHVNPTNGETCNAPPMTGEHFCFSHNPRMAAEREEAQRAGGRNRRQPEPPPRIPPNLPYVKLETRAHIQLVYEVTLNYVLQGQMDLRVANTIGYLAMGALATLDSQARADRQAAQDAEKAAEKDAEKAGEKAAAKAGEKAAEKAASKPAEAAENAVAQKTEDKAQKAAEREPEHAKKTAPKQAEKAAEREVERAERQSEDAQKTGEAPGTVPSVYGFLGRDQYGRKQSFIYRDTATGASSPSQPPSGGR